MKSPVTPGAEDVGAGAKLEGPTGKMPSCNVSKDAAQFLTAGTANTRCYERSRERNGWTRNAIVRPRTSVPHLDLSLLLAFAAS